MNLRDLYLERFQDVLDSDHLNLEDLQASRQLFETASLVQAKPLPKRLDTYCIVGGVPFDDGVIAEISKMISEVKNVLKNCLSYFVEPQNLGVELAVLKWPESSLADGLLNQVCSFIDRNPPPRFTIDIEGFQFHKDGCLVLRGFDKNAAFREYRHKLLLHVKRMPQKQSSWCHIPLGRILGPLEQADYAILREFACWSQASHRSSIQLDSLKLLHETRWYQVEKTLLRCYQAHD